MSAMLLRPKISHAFLLRRCLSTINHLDHNIAELNMEMESIFGDPPPSSISNSHGSQDPKSYSHETSENRNLPKNMNSHTHELSSSKTCQPDVALTHVDSTGEARMVDISTKGVSKRVAAASCKVLLGEKVFNLVAANQIGKGDVLNVAKIAGITGAKQTSSLIPLCHNINLTHVSVDLSLNDNNFSVDILGEAATTGRTGVEMEALTAVTIAGLTVYDMCKAASKDIQITDIRLEKKSGGQSGTWVRKH